jgi:hypothetical protein
MTLQEISRQAAWQATDQWAYGRPVGSTANDLMDYVADAVTLAVLKEVRDQISYKPMAKDCTFMKTCGRPTCRCSQPFVLKSPSETWNALLASLVIPQEPQVIEKKEDLGGTSLTEGASVSVVVPAPELPHVATTSATLAEVIIDAIPEAMGITPDPWPEKPDDRDGEPHRTVAKILDSEIGMLRLMLELKRRSVALLIDQFKMLARVIEDDEPENSDQTAVTVLLVTHRLRKLAEIEKDTDGNQATTQSSGVNRGSEAHKDSSSNRTSPPETT